MQVAAAHTAAEARDLVGGPVAVDVARQTVGGGIGQHHAGQAIEVGEVGAGDRRHRAQVAEIERLLHRAVGSDVGGAGTDVHVERIGAIALHLDQWTTDQPGHKGRRVEGSGSVQMEGVGAGAARILGGGDPAD